MYQIIAEGPEFPCDPVLIMHDGAPLDPASRILAIVNYCFYQKSQPPLTGNADISLQGPPTLQSGSLVKKSIYFKNISVRPEPRHDIDNMLG